MKNKKKKNVKTALKDEILDNLEVMHMKDPSSAEYKNAVETTSMLIDKYSSLDKKSLRIEKMIDYAIRIGAIVIPVTVDAALAVWGTKVTFEYEREGVISTFMGRGFINKLVPKKR